MKGNTIVVQGNPRGVFLEGKIGDTSLPGTIMMLQAGTDPSLGEPTWVEANFGTDGFPGLIAVLREDYLQGKLVSDAYVSGTRCFLYCPLAGEDMNVRCGEGGGTSNTFTIGQRLMIDSDKGYLIPSSGSPISVPFVSMEHDVLVADDTLVFCKCTGH